MRPTPRTEAIGTAKLVSPIFTNTAWVTARVCGRRRVKVVPLPLREAMSSVPPSWRTSSEEHTSELQSLMRTSYAVFCLKKKNTYKHLSKYHNSYHIITLNENKIQ